MPSPRIQKCLIATIAAALMMCPAALAQTYPAPPAPTYPAPPVYPAPPAPVYPAPPAPAPAPAGYLPPGPAIQQHLPPFTTTPVAVSSGTLPFTGLDLALFAGFGLCLVGLGLLLRSQARRGSQAGRA